MKIVDVEMWPFEAGGTIGTQAYRRTHAALKVVTDAGLAGISRVAPAAAKTVEQVLKPALIGEDPRNAERLRDKMARLTREANVARASGVIGAVDIALWDLAGEAANTSCWQLLGGYRDWGPAYADVPTRATSPAELGEQLAACVTMGFDAVKFHILNRDPDDVVTRRSSRRRPRTSRRRSTLTSGRTSRSSRGGCS